MVRELCAYPVDEVKLSAFILMICLRIGVPSLNVYLAGVRDAHITCYGPWMLEGNEMVHRTLRFVRRRYPAGPPEAKLPISLALLRWLLPMLPGWPCPLRMSRDDFVFALASVVAVSAFLRGGEAFVVRGSKRAVLLNSMIKMVDVDVEGRGVRGLVVSIPQPKEAGDRAHVDVPCFSCPGAGDFDPVVLWCNFNRRYIVGADSPAFSMSGNVPMSRDFMVKRTARLMEEAGLPLRDEVGNLLKIKAASWRAGGVRSALDAGLSEDTIMSLGRWSSEAWKCYRRYTAGDKFYAAMRMVEKASKGAVPSPRVDMGEAALGVG